MFGYEKGSQTTEYIWSLVFFACFYLIIKVAYISYK